MGQPTVKFVILGDIALNGSFIDQYKKGRNPFFVFDDIFSSKDYVIGNLESMAKGNGCENTLKEPRLTTTIETLNYLKYIHLDVACLAQNHIYDHLESGFIKTVDFLKSNGISCLGAGYSKKEASLPLILSKKGIKIGLLNYVTEDTNPNLPEDAIVTPNIFDEIKAVEDIKELGKKVDHTIVSLHWGGKVEGALFPDYNQPKIAKKLIDAGADLIFGHHSHTFQPYEVYKDKYIFYSLGNFCFSPFWFDEKFYPLPKRRKLTGIANIEFSRESYSINIKFYRNHIEFFEELPKYSLKKRNWVYKYLLKRKFFWQPYYFYQKHIEPFLLFIFSKDLGIKNKVFRISKSISKKILDPIFKSGKI